MSSASVSFTPPSNDGGSPITGYTVTSNPGSIIATGITSPIVVSGLTDGTPYTFTVRATNLLGDGPESSPSNMFTYVASDQYFSNVSALFPFDTSFEDTSWHVTATGVGTPAINSVHSKWGGASLSVNSTSTNYLNLSGLSNFGASDFTVEGWIYLTSLNANYATIFSSSNAGLGGTNNIWLGIQGSGNLYAGIRTAIISSTSNLATINTWHHVALVRSGTTYSSYLNGDLIGSVTNTDTISANSTPTIGGSTEGNRGFTGYIDDFRITQGVARYTSNFTPPAVQFPDFGPTLATLRAGTGNIPLTATIGTNNILFSDASETIPLTATIGTNNILYSSVESTIPLTALRA